MEDFHDVTWYQRLIVNVRLTPDMILLTVRDVMHVSNAFASKTTLLDVTIVVTLLQISYTGAACVTHSHIFDTAWQK